MNEELDTEEQAVVAAPPLQVTVKAKRRYSKPVRTCLAISATCIIMLATYGYFKSIWERSNLSTELRCRSVATIAVSQANTHASTVILQALRALADGDTVLYNSILDEVPKVVKEMQDATAGQEDALRDCHKT